MAEDDSAKWAELRDEMSKPDPDPVVASIEAREPVAEPQRREPTHAELADRYMDDPRALDNWQPQQRQQQRSTEHDHGADIADYRQPDNNSGLPDVHEDPIAHFNMRNSAIEQAVMGDRFMSALDKAEKHAADELGADEYNAAIQRASQAHMYRLYEQWPDTPATEQIARAHGHPSAAHMRHEIFKRDVLAYGQRALANGLNPGFAYYNLGLQAGHIPGVAMTKTARKQIMDAQDLGDDAAERAFQAEKWAQKRLEENLRRQQEQRRQYYDPWLFRGR